MVHNIHNTVFGFNWSKIRFIYFRLRNFGHIEAIINRASSILEFGLGVLLSAKRNWCRVGSTAVIKSIIRRVDANVNNMEVEMLAEWLSVSFRAVG